MAPENTVLTRQTEAGETEERLDHIHAIQWKVGRAIHTLKKALDQYEDELDEARTLMSDMAAKGCFAGLGTLIEDTVAAEQGARWYGRDLDSVLDSVAFSDVVRLD